jgi:phosphoribosylamine--glycine ligase
VCCAGVGRDADGRLVTAGGRVLNVTGLAPTMDQARRRAYAALAQLSWPGMVARTDISRRD